MIDAIGYLDEADFPDGYGEEYDYCFRTTNAGLALAITDHAYVFHASTRSYSRRQHDKLNRAGAKTLVRNCGSARIDAAVSALSHDPILDMLRQELGEILTSTSPPEPSELDAGSGL